MKPLILTPRILHLKPGVLQYFYVRWMYIMFVFRNKPRTIKIPLYPIRYSRDMVEMIDKLMNKRGM